MILINPFLKQILSSISETYKTLTNEKTKSEDKESKDLDQKLRLLYNTLYGNKTETVPMDNINDQFQTLFEGDNDDEIMNKILLTSFEEFGKSFGLSSSPYLFTHRKSEQPDLQKNHS